MRKNKMIIKGSFLKEFTDNTFLQSFPVISDTIMTLEDNEIIIEYSVDNYTKLTSEWKSYREPNIYRFETSSDFEHSSYYKNKVKIEVFYSGYREACYKPVTYINSIKGISE